MARETRLKIVVMTMAYDVDCCSRYPPVDPPALRISVYEEYGIVVVPVPSTGTTTIPYSSYTEILNAGGSTGGYLEQQSTSYAIVITTIFNRVSRAIDQFTGRRFYTST